MTAETQKELARHFRGIELAAKRIWEALERDIANSKSKDTDQESQDSKFQARRA